MAREREWWEKEEAYQQAYRQGKVCTWLWKYIPDRLAEAVAWVDTNLDGYWIYLNNEDEGWRAYDHAEDCGIIHEYNISDLKEAIKTIEKCEV